MVVETGYVAAVLLASGFVAAVTAWLWSPDLGRSGRLFVLLAALHPIVGVFVVAELLAPRRSLAVLFYNLHTGLSSLVPLAFLLFALSYAGHHRTVSRRLLGGVGVYAAVVVGLEVTNPVHGLARSEYRTAGEVVPHLVGTPTPSFMLLTLPVFVAYYAAMGVIGYRVLVHRGEQWRQPLALFVGFLAPLAVSGLIFAGLLPGPVNGAFVIGSGWMVGFAGWAVFRYQLFDVVPLAREAVFDALDEAVLVVDEDRRLLDYNDSAVRVFPELSGNAGRPVDDVLPALVDPDADSAPFASTFRRHEGPTPREYTVTVSPVRTDGHVRGYAVVVRDITDRQQRIRDLERQKAQLERFASTLSHDIRNPLNVARGRAELAADDGDNDDLARVLDALDRIDRIIEDLLRLSREGRAIDDRERVRLADVAREAWANTVTGGATLSVDADADVAVYADPSRLLNVFENLFRNCMEHGSTGDPTDPDALSVTLGRHADGFYVEDDGPGIPPGERDAVFEYEYTTADGTGLGLAIVAAIAEANGWSVDARAGDAGGARIVFAGVEMVEEDRPRTDRPTSA